MGSQEKEVADMVAAGSEADMAAARIQARVRGSRDRAELAAMGGAAVLIQAQARGRLVRNAILDAEEADWAATKVQAAFRGHVGRAEFMARAESRIDELADQRLREEQAATAIQAAYHGLRPRRDFAETVAAVVAIQAHARGHLRREALVRQLEEDLFNLQTAAATTIQSAHRGREARRHFYTEHAEKSAAAVKLQTAYRRSSATRQYDAQKLAAECLQPHVRGWLVRNQMRQDAEAVERELLEEDSALLILSLIHI